MTTQLLDHTMNGVVAMPIKSTVIELDEVGYPGWKCKVRTNPRSEVWDKFLEESDPEKTWEVLSECILDWNFGDENGDRLPLPPETKRTDLPLEVPGYIITKFIDAFNDAVTLPKRPKDNSEDSSQTKNET